MRRLLLLVFLLLFAAVPAAAEAADTLPATDVGRTTATVHGNVGPGSYHFDYGTTSSYELETAEDTSVTGGDVSAQLSGLSADTTYHFRVVSASGDGGDRTFHTIDVPRVNSGGVREVRVDGAILYGKVDANRSPTTWWYEYGRTRDYGSETPEVDGGHGSTSRDVTAVLAGLKPNTTYHFRIAAVNDAGIHRGADRSFRTLRQPTGITVTFPTRTVAFGAVTKIAGKVQGVAVNGVRVALEAQAFPFTSAMVAAGPPITTARDGSFTITSPPLWISTRMRVVTRSTLVATSPQITAFSRVLVGARLVRLGRRRGSVEGNVTPNVRGARVSLQRRGKRGHWSPVRRTKAKRLAPGRFGYRIAVTRARRARVYRVVVVPKNAAHVRGTSRTLRVPRLARKHKR